MGTTQIWAQPVSYNGEEIESTLNQVQPGLTFSVKTKIYYPYYFFRFHLKARRLFLPVNEEVGCTVEPVSGTGSLIDQKPQLILEEIMSINQMPPTQSFHECKTVSESFVYRSLSLKMKMLSISDLTLEHYQLFYRPYWVANSANTKAVPDFIVDAVTGQYHPL